MNGLPPVNLYFLWSVERVAVLYNLPTIGDKDWYRWGAEKLVANQGPLGNWDKGGYHGASPVIDTCLALLFLKRANFVEDLAARLPIDPKDLARDIHKKTTKPPEGKKEDKPAPPPESVPSTGKPPDGAEQPALSPYPIEGKPEGPAEQAQEARGKGNRTLWVVLFLAFAALVVAGFGIGLALYLRSGRRHAVEEEDLPPARRRPEASPPGADGVSPQARQKLSTASTNGCSCSNIGRCPQAGRSFTSACGRCLEYASA
jgi:hypothetical protein